MKKLQVFLFLLVCFVNIGINPFFDIEKELVNANSIKEDIENTVNDMNKCFSDRWPHALDVKGTKQEDIAMIKLFKCYEEFNQVFNYHAKLIQKIQLIKEELKKQNKEDNEIYNIKLRELQQFNVEIQTNGAHRSISYVKKENN